MGKDLSKQLAAWRREMGYTQREAAVFFAVPVDTYSGWEQGYRKVQNAGPVERLMRLAPIRYMADEIIRKTAPKS